MSIKVKVGVRYLRYKIKKFFTKENEREVQVAVQDGITEARKEINSVLDQVEDTTRSISTDLVAAGFQIGPNISEALGAAYKANPRVVEQLYSETTDGINEVKLLVKTLGMTSKQPHLSEIFGIYESMMKHAKRIAQTVECNEPECKAVIAPIVEFLKVSATTITNAIPKSKEETNGNTSI